MRSLAASLPRSLTRATLHRWDRMVAFLEQRTAALRSAPELVIFDDFYPHPFSAPRFAELTGYLTAFPGAGVHTSGSSLPIVGIEMSVSRLIEIHLRSFPEHRSRIHPFEAGNPLRGKVLYSIFLNNINVILDVVNRDHLPFIFTLYPGGGFKLNMPDSDEKLRRVFGSPYFRAVIVTQPVARDYIVDRRFCATDRIRMIYGGLLPDQNASAQGEKQLYGVHKSSVDICFVAWRYMPQGLDKGYGTFVAVARDLARQFDFVRFHAVGPWGPEDADIGGLGDRIHFHPPMMTAELRQFFRSMDLILAPVVPFVLAPGAFDGFPTGACVEAAFAGVAVCTCDELKQNVPFTNGKDILIVSPQPSQIAGALEHYLRNYDQLLNIASRGYATASRVYGWEAQMAPRIGALSDLQLLPAAAPIPPPPPLPALAQYL
jgi:glycosyltransferase involved in cell wall biosynthesis